jgi:16S rRNA (cytidine1402-2'-O)-methyltransferase
MKQGTLYICSAHLGDMTDMTYRTIEVLKNVQMICAEDTREFKKISDKYGISTPLMSYHLFNEHDKLFSILRMLNRGEDVALIPDRGTPVVNDPGFLLIREYGRTNSEFIKILPGPSAAIAAFVLSGLSHRYMFLGFVNNYNELKIFIEFPYAIVIFEAPHRILKFLQAAYETFGNRSMCICREITKKYEQIIHCKLGEIPEFEHKGELTIVIGPE